MENKLYRVTDKLDRVMYVLAKNLTDLEKFVYLADIYFSIDNVTMLTDKIICEEELEVEFIIEDKDNYEIKL